MLNSSQQSIKKPTGNDFIIICSLVISLFIAGRRKENNWRIKGLSFYFKKIIKRMLVYDVKLWTKKDSDTSFSGGYVFFFVAGLLKVPQTFFSWSKAP